MFELAKESCFVCKEVEVFSEMRVFLGGGVVLFLVFGSLFSHLYAFI